MRQLLLGSDRIELLFEGSIGEMDSKAGKTDSRAFVGGAD
jgi:hypothetical protein